jgi:hypothetical protein
MAKMGYLKWALHGDQEENRKEINGKSYDFCTIEVINRQI